MYYIQLYAFDKRWRTISSKEVRRLTFPNVDSQAIDAIPLSHVEAEKAAEKLRKMDSSVQFQVVPGDKINPSEGFIQCWMPSY